MKFIYIFFILLSLPLIGMEKHYPILERGKLCLMPYRSKSILSVAKQLRFFELGKPFPLNPLSLKFLAALKVTETNWRHHKIPHNHLKALQIVCEHGADLEKPGFYCGCDDIACPDHNLTAAEIALKRGNIECYNLLMQYGAKRPMNPKQDQTLFDAIIDNNLEIIPGLIAAGANIYAEHHALFCTPAEFAEHYNKQEAYDLLKKFEKAAAQNHIK